MGLSSRYGIHQFAKHLLQLALGEVVFLHKFFVRQPHPDVVPQLNDADAFHCFAPFRDHTGIHEGEILKPMWSLLFEEPPINTELT